MPEVTMPWLDTLLIAIIALSALTSLLRGFVKEALSLVAWIAAYMVAKFFYPALSAEFVGRIEPEFLRNAIACVVLFVATLFVGGLLNTLIGKLIAAGGLSGTDRMLGMVFGGARGLLIVAALAYFLTAFTRLPEQPWWRESHLVGPLQQIGVWFFDNFGDKLPATLPSVPTLTTAQPVPAKPSA